MTQLTVGSLFSGIGGIELGLERVGFEIAWQVEIDSYAQKVLAKHWPHVARYGDIRTVGKHNLAPVDLLAGGFPCQPHSLAGKRQASADDRDLWEEFYRIICELRPTWVLAENVPGLLSSEDGRFLGRVLRDLAQSGYDAEWQMLSAEAFGAPHLRERVFIVGYPMRVGCRRQGLQHYSGTLSSERGQEVGTMADSDRQRTQIPSSRILTTEQEPQRSSWWAIEPQLDRVVNGVSHRVDRLRGLGNAVVPQIATYIGECILASLREEEVAG